MSKHKHTISTISHFSIPIYALVLAPFAGDGDALWMAICCLALLCISFLACFSETNVT